MYTNILHATWSKATTNTKTALLLGLVVLLGYYYNTHTMIPTPSRTSSFSSISHVS